MENYINKIVEVCTSAKPNQKMMFGGFGKYVLHVQKDSYYVEGTDKYNLVDIEIYEMNGVIRDGKPKDLLVGDETGVHVSELHKLLTGIADGTRKLTTL